MHLRCVIWEDPGRTVRNLISALLMCHGSQLDQSLTTLWLRPNRLLTAVLWHWMICRLRLLTASFTKPVADNEIKCRSPASWFLSPWRPLLQEKMAARSMSCKWILGEVEGWVPAVVAESTEIGQTVDKSEKWWRCHPEGRIYSTKQLAAGPYQSNLSKWGWHISKG